MKRMVKSNVIMLMVKTSKPNNGIGRIFAASLYIFFFSIEVIFFSSISFSSFSMDVWDKVILLSDEMARQMILTTTTINRQTA